MPGKKDLPQIRFRSFEAPWTRSALEDCFEERQERSSEGDLISVTIHSGLKKFSELGRYDNSSEDKSHYKKVEVGDIAYNTMRMWQGACGYSPYSGILSPAYTVLVPKAGVNSLFFSYAFKKAAMIHQFQLHSQGITSDTWNLKYPVFGKIACAMPAEAEQAKIAEYLACLDRLIRSCQHKCGKLQRFKKSLLEKMFPQEGSDAPELRFQGFRGDWERRPLGFYLETAREKNLQNTYTKSDVLSVSGEYGVINQIKHKGRSFAGAAVTNYGIVKQGDVVYTKSPLRDTPYGIIKTNMGAPGIVSALYAVYHPKSCVYPPFVQTYFELDRRLNQYLRPIISKGAKNTINISDDDALLGTVCFPGYEEQQAISGFFAAMDRLIAASAEELEKLQLLKKALLEKMLV